MILVEEGFRGRPVLLSRESTGELGGNLDMLFVSRLLEDNLGIFRPRQENVLLLGASVSLRN